jgi:hypothetical protein
MVAVGFIPRIENAIEFIRHVRDDAKHIGHLRGINSPATINLSPCDVSVLLSMT